MALALVCAPLILEYLVLFCCKFCSWRENSRNFGQSFWCLCYDVSGLLKESQVRIFEFF